MHPSLCGNSGSSVCSVFQDYVSDSCAVAVSTAKPRPAEQRGRGHAVPDECGSPPRLRAPPLKPTEGREAAPTAYRTFYSPEGKAVEEGGGRTGGWPRIWEGRGAAGSAFSWVLPRVRSPQGGPEAPEAHMRPGMERRDSCGMCGVYGGNRHPEPPVPAEHTRVTSWSPSGTYSGGVASKIKATGSEDRK